MKEEVKAHLFEPFFTTKDVGKGTGMGLAMVHGIVKQSGGHIAVYTEVGRGTTFKVYLPRLEEEAKVKKPDSGQFKIPRGKETILLAEDEDAVRALAKLILETTGYTVLAARNGKEAMEIARKHKGPLHMLVSDVVMPQMGGRQLADLLTPLHPGLKVLYVSGYADEAIVRHGVLEGGVAFLQKPYAPATLARKVREVLDAEHKEKAAEQPREGSSP
jgi:CheY-like chemotaxis protein